MSARRTIGRRVATAISGSVVWLVLALVLVGQSWWAKGQAVGTSRTAGRTIGTSCRAAEMSAGSDMPAARGDRRDDEGGSVPSSISTSPPRQAARFSRARIAWVDIDVTRYRRISSSIPRSPSHDLILKDVRSGGRIYKSFIVPRGSGGEAARETAIDAGGRRQGVTYYFDTPGARNIRIEVDDEVGETRYAGLRFRDPCTVGILQDGTVTVDQAGLGVSDESGRSWTSRAIQYGASRLNVFVPSIARKAQETREPEESDSGDGRNQVEIANPQACSVRITFRDGDYDRVFTLSGHAKRTFNLPDGRYETFYRFSDEPGALYQGQRLDLNGRQATIVLLERNGNASLRRVK